MTLAMSMSSFKPNKLLRSCCRLAALCDRYGVHWLWEQPKGSLMWKTRGWKRLFAAPGLRHHTARVDWCQYGRPWRKPTLFRGTAPWIDELTRVCCGGHTHLRLEGTAKDPSTGRHRSRTAIASEYSSDLCSRVFELATEARGGWKGHVGTCAADARGTGPWRSASSPIGHA